MLSQTCARRELAALSDGLGCFAGTSEGILFGRYARLVGAPNCAPSLRSVAGLLLALALQGGYEDALTLLPTKFVTARGVGAAHRFARVTYQSGRARSPSPRLTLADAERAEAESEIQRAEPTRASEACALKDLDGEAWGVLGRAP